MYSSIHKSVEDISSWEPIEGPVDTGMISEEGILVHKDLYPYMEAVRVKIRGCTFAPSAMHRHPLPDNKYSRQGAVHTAVYVLLPDQPYALGIIAAYYRGDKTKYMLVSDSVPANEARSIYVGRHLRTTTLMNTAIKNAMKYLRPVPPLVAMRENLSAVVDPMSAKVSVARRAVDSARYALSRKDAFWDMIATGTDIASIFPEEHSALCAGISTKARITGTADQGVGFTFVYAAGVRVSLIHHVLDQYMSSSMPKEPLDVELVRTLPDSLMGKAAMLEMVGAKTFTDGVGVRVTKGVYYILDDDMRLTVD